MVTYDGEIVCRARKVLMVNAENEEEARMLLLEKFKDIEPSDLKWEYDVEWVELDENFRE